MVVVKCDFRVRQKGEPSSRPVDLEAIPYFAYLNRGPSEFRVWIPEAESGADVADVGADPATPTASHCHSGDSVYAMKDGVVPAKSSDTSKSRMSWWDHKGTVEWVQYDFPQASKVSKTRVFWFADRPVKGGRDLPQSWRLLYRNGNAWTPVENRSGYGLAADKFNEATFVPVITTSCAWKSNSSPTGPAVFVSGKSNDGARWLVWLPANEITAADNRSC